MNKKFLAGAIILLGVFGFFVNQAKAGSDDNVWGWAWSENIGWVSFNSITDGSSISYGVNIKEDGVFEGYAWSRGTTGNTGGIGWITFNEDDLTGCPLPPCRAWVGEDGNVSGWARAYRPIAPEGQALGGWTGWMRLDDLNINTETGYFHNWAWGGGGHARDSAVIGWVSFNCVEGGPNQENVCSGSDYKVETSFSFDLPLKAAMSCQIVQCNGPGCVCNGVWSTFNGPGVDYRINNDSTPIDSIVKSTWSIIDHQDPYLTCPPDNPDPLCNMTMPTVIGAGDYIIKLTVENEEGQTDSVSHPITVKQDATADFDCSLDNESWESDCQKLVVYPENLVYLKDRSQPSDGAVIDSREWKKNNEVFDSNNNATTSFPVVEGENKITLTIKDSQSRGDSAEKTIHARLSLPEYREVPPIIWLRKFLASLTDFFNGFLSLPNG